MGPLALVLLALAPQREPAPVLPPYAEVSAPLTSSGPPAGVAFAPGLGALVATVGGTKGPSHGAFTNAATLDFLYMPDADLVARSDQGGATWFRRCYRSNLSFAGAHSPGLPVGWVHNYDVVIEPSADTTRWRAMRMLWPNGAVEKVSPILDEKGFPTGELAHGPGQPFAMKGEVGDGLNRWKSITILWKGGFFWKFDPHASGALVLRETGNVRSPLVGLRMGYDAERRLLEITRPPERTPVLRLDYANGLLARAEDALAGNFRTYTYAPLKASGATVLWKVSELASGAAKPKDGFAYAYADVAGAVLLNAISIPDPSGGAGWAGMKVEYEKGSVVAMVDAEGNRKEFARP